MSDLELLFLVLALIYVWECACWVPFGSIAFSTWLGRRWRRAEPLLRNQKGGFAFAPMLPPLGTLLACHPLPVIISPEAVAAAPQTSNPGKKVAFSAIKKIGVEGKKVLINGDLF